MAASQKIVIKDVLLQTPTQVRVVLDQQERARFASAGENSSSKITFDIKNLKDGKGRDLDPVSNSTFNQFRELFVQRVYPDKVPASTVVFTRQDLPLSQNQPQPVQGGNDHWMNSPLKQAVH